MDSNKHADLIKKYLALAIQEIRDEKNEDTEVEESEEESEEERIDRSRLITSNWEEGRYSDESPSWRDRDEWKIDPTSEDLPGTFAEYYKLRAKKR